MEVVRADSAEEFLERTLALRAAEPLRTNVMGSVATHVATGGGSDRFVECYWWLLVDAGEVTAMAMRTAPFGLALSPMALPAAEALAAKVAGVDREVPWVNGSDAVAALVATRLAASYGMHSRERRREVLYSISELAVPDVPGELVAAVPDDAAAAIAWGRLFHAEALGTGNEFQPEAFTQRVNDGQLFWWVVDGERVSMAGHAAKVDTPSGLVARVGPVFTPREHRGHGYGAAVTAEVTELLMAEGCHVMLFADKANATSNGVYQRLGYVGVDEFVQLVIE
jgi:GNAT superfamily N-acetyltransferase